MKCNSSLECFLPFECYFDDSISNSGTCTCSAWYMRAGYDCLEFSLSLRIYLFLMSSVILWCFILIILYLRLLKWYFRWRYTVKNQTYIDGNLTLKPSLAPTKIAIFSFLSTLSVFFGYLSLFPVFVGDNMFYYDETDIFGDKDIQLFYKFSILSNILFFIGVFFYSFAALQISLHWLDLCSSINSILDFSLPFENKIKFLSKFIILATLIFLIGSINLYLFGYSYTIFIFLSILSLSYTCFLFISKTRTSLLFKYIPIDMKTEPAFNKTITFVNRSIKIVIPLILISTTLFTIHCFLTIHWKEYLKPGNFNFILLIKDLGIIGGLSLLSFNYWYSRTLFKNILQLWKQKIKNGNRTSRPMRSSKKKENERVSKSIQCSSIKQYQSNIRSDEDICSDRNISFPEKEQGDITKNAEETARDSF